MPTLEFSMFLRNALTWVSQWLDRLTQSRFGRATLSLLFPSSYAFLEEEMVSSAVEIRAARKWYKDISLP